MAETTAPMKLPSLVGWPLLSLAGALLFSSCCSPGPQQHLDQVQVIDTHIHLYDTNRSEGVDWPPVTDK
ncbi:MAG: hypothetical protein HOB63_08625, partial [Opitutae bacterium]|nr:hypothetical protein [Opitutae bacterium]